MREAVAARKNGRRTVCDVDSAPDAEHGAAVAQGRPRTEEAAVYGNRRAQRQNRGALQRRAVEEGERLEGQRGAAGDREVAEGAAGVKGAEPWRGERVRCGGAGAGARDRQGAPCA